MGFLNKFKENFLIIIIIIFLIFLLSFYYIKKGFVYFLLNLDLDSIINFINGFGALAMFVFVLLVILEVVIAPIPAFVLYVAGGVIFGSFSGGGLALIGNMIGAIIAFGLARKYGYNLFSDINKKNRLFFNKMFEKYGWATIFILRINPITSSDVVSYLAGVSKISLKNFFLGTLFGLAPLIFIQTYLGGDVVMNNSFLFLIFIIFSLIYVIIFFYWIYKTLRKQFSENK